MERNNFNDLVCCTRQWIPQLQNSFIGTICENDISDVKNYSARQLRNLLLQDLKVSHDIVNKIIDRKALKDLAESILYSSQFANCRNTFTHFGTIMLVFLLFTAILFICRHFIWEIFKFLTGNFVNISQMEQRFFILRKSLKKYRSMFGAIAILLAFILDFAALYIQVSALLSWVVPYHWTLYRYLWFGIPLPVNAGDIMSQYMGSKTSNQDRWKSSAVNGDTGSMRGWTINAGPMLTMSAMRYITYQLDQFATRRFLKVKTDQKRDSKHTKKTSNDQNTEIVEDKKDPWAAGENGNAAGRGHGYAANYRNNTAESANWLLRPKKGNDDQSPTIQTRSSSTTLPQPNITADRREVADARAEPSHESPSPLLTEEVKSSESDPSLLPKKKPASSRHPLHEDDGWASDY